MTPEEKRRRERFWAQETCDPDFMKYEEYEWLAAGIEPTIQEQADRYKNGGWLLGGFNGLRHWVRDRLRIRVKAGRREICPRMAAAA